MKQNDCKKIVLGSEVLVKNTMDFTNTMEKIHRLGLVHIYEWIDVNQTTCRCEHFRCEITAQKCALVSSEQSLLI